MAMLSIMALYNYIGSSLFDGLRVPEGMDKDTVTDNILLECGELSLLYTDPTFMTRAIAQWTNKEFNIWQKLYDTENLEYNPIWNVDGTVEETENIDRGKTGSASRNTTGSVTTQDDLTSNDTRSVAGYNSSEWQGHEKDDITSDRDIHTSSTGSETANDREDEDVVRELVTHRTGNIGVTTTQQMIREEREVATFNTIDYITQSFKKRFCIMIY